MEEEVILKVVVTEERWVAYGPGSEEKYAVEQVEKVAVFRRSSFQHYG